MSLVGTHVIEYSALRDHTADCACERNERAVFRHRATAGMMQSYAPNGKAQQRSVVASSTSPTRCSRRIRLAASVLRCAGMKPADVDVAVVGGGPGGLASAAAIV